MKKALLAVIVFALPLFAAGKFETHGGAGGAASRYRVSVQLDPTDDLASAAAQLAATYGARLESVDGSTTFVVTASEANARLLSADRRVSFVGDADPSLPIGVGSPYAGFGTYTYDGAGNITSVGDHTFTYDPYQRIRTATLGAGTGRSASYTYDQYGNIRTIVTDGNGADTMTLPVDTATNRLTSTGGNVSADYDAAGNLTSYNSGAMTFAYDALDMVQEATVNGTRRLHLYSATNERIATVQMVGNTPSRWDWTIRDASGKVLRRFSKNNANTWSWDEDYIYRDTQMLASALPADQTLYFHADHLGTPRVITNAAGNVVAQHTYYPFGAEVPTSTADAERKKFTGHERDDINLDYMHARYYMPYSGRFLSVDPVMDVKRHLRKPQGWNRYAYVENNPINLTDPTGKCPECVAASSCINCQDEIAEAVRVRSTQIEIQQMADLGDSLASEFASGNGRAEALGLGPLDAVAFGMSLRAVRAAPALRFASQASFETHFAKHGAEFGFKTAGEYLKGAAKLISSAGQKGVQSFTRANGDKVVYRAATNEFAVVTRNNVVRTFFKPKGGVEYYVRQLFAAAEEKLAKAAAQ